MKKYIYVLATVWALGACTSDFEETNTNPYQITDESLKQDFNNIGAFFPSLLSNLYGIQIDHNLTNDSYARHLATPTPFVGGVNNTTYYLRWNRYWDVQYGNVMGPATK
ncbi:SusD/RagB family nutrient-binding outer membrane lipoprotein [Flagellimonas onchidii]|uniref:SusD/RagB family nutrient-binding outer membrane lipoprotein n=1 Tax=Flagellimonas onchidii TaxID=2562684 RepID=UPI00197AD5B5|nr:SusD/RagB family nutrient-binding outer membrane lipoprotein [Allomuricauda onchidii]